MNRPIYRRKDNWVLGICETCHALNYVEPHGTTAHCKRCKSDTEHVNVPMAYRDNSGSRVIHAVPSKKATAVL